MGGGITADSVPIREWYECLHKAAPLVTRRRRVGWPPTWPTSPDRRTPACVAAGVFESLLAVRGESVRLAGHLARLDRSCRELYGLGLPDGPGRPDRRRTWPTTEPAPSGWPCGSRSGRSGRPAASS